MACSRVKVRESCIPRSGVLVWVRQGVTQCHLLLWWISQYLWQGYPFNIQATILNATVQCHTTPIPPLRTGVPAPGVQAPLVGSALVSVPSCKERKGRLPAAWNEQWLNSAGPGSAPPPVPPGVAPCGPSRHHLPSQRLPAAQPLAGWPPPPPSSPS